MAKFINQNSYFLFGGIILIGLSVFLFRKGFHVHQAAVFAAVLGLLLAGWLLLRPQQTEVSSAREVEALIGSGTPVLLEFQSPF